MSVWPVQEGVRVMMSEGMKVTAREGEVEGKKDISGNHFFNNREGLRIFCHVLGLCNIAVT